MTVKKNTKNKGPKTYLCFDLGTTRIKSALIDDTGNIIYLDSEKATSCHDGESIIQEPGEYYHTVEKQIKKIAHMNKEFFRYTRSIIISGQMAGVLSIDKNWEVVFPWTSSVDTRANKYLKQIESNMGSGIRKSSGGLPFTAAKIKWIKDKFPKKYKESYKFLNLTTYVAGKLTGSDPNRAFIDYSVLAMNGLADVENGRWNISIIRKLGLDLEKLPLIVHPYDITGIIPKKKFNTLNDIQVLAGIGDQIAGFIGAGAVKKGDLIDATGTYSVLGYVTDRYIPDTSKRIVSSIYSGIGDIYYHLGVAVVGGYLHNWFENRFNYDSKNIKVPSRYAGDLFFIPHLGGKVAPPQPDYKGAFYGLRWNHDINSIYIAMLECMGYEYSFMLENIKRLNKIKEDFPKSIEVIGGGAENNMWNRIKADILDLEYIIPKDAPFEIMGDYLVAKYGKDLREGISNINIPVSEKIRPERNMAKYYARQKNRYKKVSDGIGKIYMEMEQD